MTNNEKRKHRFYRFLYLFIEFYRFVGTELEHSLLKLIFNY